MRKILYFLLIGIIATMGWAKTKPKLAVVDFKEISTQVPNVGQFVANKINDICYSIKSIEVIDRANLDQILKEQNIALSGIVDSFDSDKIGRISGLNYLIVGSVSQCYVTRKYVEQTKKIKQKNGTYITKLEKKWEWVGNGTIQLRVLDVVSGKVMYSGTKTGVVKEYENYVPKKIIKKVVKNKSKSKMDKILKVPRSSTSTTKIEVIVPPTEDTIDANKERPKLVFAALSRASGKFRNDLYNQFRPTGYIISITPYKGKKFKVTLDVGQDFGIKKGKKFLVIQKGHTIVHPVTKELITSEDVVIGKIKIKNVGSQTSYAIVDKKMVQRLKVGQVIKAQKTGGCLF